MQFIQSPNCWPTRSGYAPRWLILHGTAGGSSAQAIANYFANPTSEVSAHYVIGQDGTVIQCVAEAEAAWANGGVTAGHDPWWNPAINPNLLTISIEHVKASTDNSDALTPAQQAASFALIKDICAGNGIPMRAADASGGITGHFSMDPVNRGRCPGTYPWNALWSYLQQQGGTMIPEGWKDNGAILVAPNGFEVTLGFRDFVLSNNWPSWNWPVEAAHGQTPLELSDPALGGGTQQLFRRAPLEWSPTQGVFEAWSGPEIQALRALIAAQATQIAALQAQLAKATTTTVKAS